MRKIIYILTIVSLVACNSADSGGLPKISYIGKSTSDAASKFGQLFPDRGCTPRVINKLSTKYGPNIKCFLMKHKKVGGGLQIQLTSSQDKIVESRFTWYDDTSMRTNIKVFPKVKDHFGDSKPDFIVKQKQKYGKLNMYTATWEKESGRAYAFGICTPISVGKNQSETPKLRDCYLQAIMFYKKTNDPLPESFKAQDKSY